MRSCAAKTEEGPLLWAAYVPCRAVYAAHGCFRGQADLTRVGCATREEVGALSDQEQGSGGACVVCAPCVRAEH